MDQETTFPTGNAETFTVYCWLSVSKPGRKLLAQTRRQAGTNVEKADWLWNHFEAAVIGTRMHKSKREKNLLANLLILSFSKVDFVRIIEKV
ncbi:MAG TPA: hypothetical protein VFT53_03015 [Candidatus Saccharimonadales bacterium]|nr:hypothetical protein [Candidatus Saccharimonadales bacterium]